MKVLNGSLRTVSGTVLALLAMSRINMSLNFAGMGFEALMILACYVLLAVALFAGFRGAAAAGAVCGLLARVTQAGGFSTVFNLIAHFRPTPGNLAILIQILSYILLIACFAVKRNRILPPLTAIACLAGFLILPGMNGVLAQYTGSGTTVSTFFYQVIAVPLTFITSAFVLGC